MLDILFINATESNKLREKINGTMLLATKLIEAKFSVDVLGFYQVESYHNDYNIFVEEFTEKIISLNPKCISFYTLWPCYHTMLRIASEVKKRNINIITVFGGPQSASCAAETIRDIEYIDYVCTGEGENTVVPFFDCILNKSCNNINQIPGLYYREKGEVKFNHLTIPLTDLNSLPIWNEKFFTDAKYEMNISSKEYFMPIDVGRGCPYNCTFCASSIFWDRKYRLKSPQKIIDEIKFYKNKFGIISFRFSHDAFTINKELVSQVCDHIIEDELDINWECTSRVNCITEELVLKMKAAGMTDIALGIETGSEKMQKIVKKNLNLAEAKEKIKFLIKSGIKVSLFFMYGFPEETEEDLNKTLDFVFWALNEGVISTGMSYCHFNASTEMTEKYLNELYLEPNIKILPRGIFGYYEELEMIKSHKEIFSHFYHLNTLVRDDYQYVRFLISLYRKFPTTFNFALPLYNGNYLKLYKDLYNNNLEIFNDSISIIQHNVIENPANMVLKTFKTLEKGFFEKIKAVLEYENDIKKVHNSKEDIKIKKKYNFSMIDLQMKLPITQFSNMKTEVLLQKKNDKFEMTVLNIK